MIATTTIADGIAIMVFATVLFLLGAGVLWLLKLLFRLIRGKPRPVEPQGVCVFFEMDGSWKRDADDEDELDETGEGGGSEMMRFASYLESRIHSERLGDFDGGVVEDRRVGLYFYGPDAKRIWERIEEDVRTYAPAKPLEVRFDLGKKRGGKQVVNIADDPPRQPETLPDFEKWNPAAVVSSAWTMVFRMGGALTLIGFVGLFLNSLGRKVAGVSGQEVMRSGTGAFVVFGLSGMFILGMVLCLIFVCHIQQVSKRPSPGPMGRAMQGPVLPSWISNKFILAIVAAVIAGVMIMLLERW